MAPKPAAHSYQNKTLQLPATYNTYDASKVGYASKPDSLTSKVGAEIIIVTR